MAKKETAVYRQWWFLAAAAVLVWPVGAVLLALKFTALRRRYAGVALLPENKVPFQDEKTTAQIKIYRGHISKQKSKLNTALATTVICLLVGCAGITLTWVKAISGGFGAVQPAMVGAYVLFALAGIMQATRAYDLLDEKLKIARMAAIIDDRQSVTEAELAAASGMDTAQVRLTLQTMFDRCYFADGVHADEENGVFVCCK